MCPSGSQRSPTTRRDRPSPVGAGVATQHDRRCRPEAAAEDAYEQSLERSGGGASRTPIVT